MRTIHKPDKISSNFSLLFFSLFSSLFFKETSWENIMIFSLIFSFIFFFHHIFHVIQTKENNFSHDFFPFLSIFREPNIALVNKNEKGTGSSYLSLINFKKGTKGIEVLLKQRNLPILSFFPLKYPRTRKKKFVTTRPCFPRKKKFVSTRRCFPLKYPPTRKKKFVTTRRRFSRDNSGTSWPAA